MWRPGFDYVERRQAILYGLHRALCVYSHVHRGTAQKPGLVMGLDLGGACHGIAFRVAGKNWQKTVDYLRALEQVTGVYLETVRTIHLLGKPGRKVKALSYRADHNHYQYAGALDIDTQLKLINQGHGQSGAARDYVLSTAAHLEEIGVHDKTLHTLAARLGAAPGRENSSG